MLEGGTDAAYRQLLTGGTFLRRLEVWRGGERIDTYGEAGVPILDGSLSANLENRVTRQLHLTLPAELFPVADGDLLDPTASELVLWCGWRGGGGVDRMWKVFTGPVVTTSARGSGSGFELDASDRVEQIVSDSFISPVQSGAGRLVTAAIKDLISDSQPGAVFGLFDETYATVPALTWESDRAQVLDSLASGVGCHWYQLPDGSYTLRIIPWASPALPPAVATFRDGVDQVSSTVIKSRVGVYTICQVSGEQATGNAPVSGTAIDVNEDSPTYYLGPLGRRVLKVRADSVSTVAQAESVARQRLRQSQSRQAQVATRSLFDPALELGDPATIVTRHGTFTRALASFSATLGKAPVMAAQWRAPGGGDEE
jgi:hypothetical protein